MTPAICLAGIYFFIFILGEWTRRVSTKFPELSRKVVHILCGLTSLSLPFFIESHWVVLALVSSFAILMVFSKKNRLLPSVHRIGRVSYGAFYYPVAIYLLFILSHHQPAIYVISILVLTISDAFAALIGSKYGKITYDVEGSTKTLEGSVVFFFLTFLCVHIPLLLMTDLGRIDSLIIAFIIAILVSAFEAISPSGSDNIIIPFGTYFLLNKMTHIPLGLVVEDLYILVIIALLTTVISLFKPCGLIGVMLLNYGAITLCGFYWFSPLFLAQILFYLLSRISHKNAHFSLKPLFYHGIIPTLLIFIANATHQKELFYLPYLTSVLSGAFIVYKNYVERQILLYPVFAITLFLLTLPLFGNIPSLITVFLGSLLAYLTNIFLQKRVGNVHRIRLISMSFSTIVVLIWELYAKYH